MGHWVVGLTSGSRICVSARTGRQAELAVEAWLVEALKPQTLFSPTQIECDFPDMITAMSYTTASERRDMQRQRRLNQATQAWVERELAKITPQQQAHWVAVLTKERRKPLFGGNCRYPTTVKPTTDD